MSRQLNPAQIWSQQPLASRTASVIKSIQSGTIGISNGSASNTLTITSVSTAKAMITLQGVTTGGTLNSSKLARIELTNATTITATRIGTSEDVTIGYQVVEFY